MQYFLLSVTSHLIEAVSFLLFLCIGKLSYWEAVSCHCQRVCAC